METFSALLALCAGNSPITGEFPSQRPVALNFKVFFDLRLNKWLSKQSRRRWFETPSRSLWRHCNVVLCCVVVMSLTVADSFDYSPIFFGLFYWHCRISWQCVPLKLRQMVAISQTTFSNAFPQLSQKRFQFPIKFHSNLLQWTINQHWIRCQAIIRTIDDLFYWHIYALLSLNQLNSHWMFQI